MSKRRQGRLTDGEYPESSSEETPAPVERAVRRRRKKQKVETPAENSAQADSPSDTENKESHARFFGQAELIREMTTEVHFKPMRELLRDVKGINMDSDCIHKVSRMNALTNKTTRRLARDRKKDIAGGAQASMSLIPDTSADVKQQLHFEQSQHEPIALIRLREARSMLIKPYFVVEGEVSAVPQAHINRLLRAKTTVALPLLTAKTQSEMLIQSGDYMFPGVGMRNLPPCCHGVKCRGMVPDAIQGLTERVVFMRAMTEQQWEDLKTHNKQPSTNANWPCILCGEYNTTHYVLQSRNLLPMGHTIRREDPDEVLQLWYNLVDEEGGYYSRFIFQPLIGEALIEPIVLPNYFMMKAYKSGGLMWKVKRDGIIYHPPESLQPKVGETEKNFQQGACFTTNNNMPSGHATSTRATMPRSCAVQSMPSVCARPSPNAACSSNSASSSLNPVTAATLKSLKEKPQTRVATIIPRETLHTPYMAAMAAPPQRMPAAAAAAAAAPLMIAPPPKPLHKRGSYLPEMHIFASLLDTDPLSI
jgi:hypothetical protein